MKLFEFSYYFFDKQNNKFFLKQVFVLGSTNSSKEVKIDIVTSTIKNNISFFEIAVELLERISISCSQIANDVVATLLHILMHFDKVNDWFYTKYFRNFFYTSTHFPVELVVEQESSFFINGINPFGHHFVTVEMTIMFHNKIYSVRIGFD